MNKNWKIEFKNEPMASVHNGVSFLCMGFYKITFNDCLYGVFSKDSFDNMKTSEIMPFIQQMLNDAYDLAVNRDLPDAYDLPLNKDN